MIQDISGLEPDIGGEQRTAVLVATCARYSQVWMPFFTLLGRYWPDCPYNLYMSTDMGQYPGVPVFQTGVDKGWASNIMNALRQIAADRIILFQEDFLLTQRVDTGTVRRLVAYSREKDTGCLRLCPCPGPSGKWTDPFLGTIGPEDSYRVSLQLAIWDRETLLGIMREGESPWELEREGRERTRLCPKPFLSLWRQPDDTPGGPVQYFITAVTRGKWEPGALELLRREGIPMGGITKVIR